MSGSDPRGEWVWVPRVPTEEMRIAGLQELPFGSSSPANATECYRAMLAAAPPAPISLLEKVVGALEGNLRKLACAETLMMADGHWRNSEGYLTDAALWIETAQTEASSVLAEVRGEIEKSNASRTDLSAHALSSAETEAGGL